MHATPFPVLLSWSLAVLFALMGFVHLSGPKILRDAYARWHYPPGFHRVTGILQVLAAIFLALAETRVWGIFLAGGITFTAVVTLLNHRQYAYAVPGMVLLVSLAPATLAVV